MKIVKAKKAKAKPQGALGFGKYFTDYMLTMEYADGRWGEPQIVPYSPFLLEPSTSVFHYGQAIFEGLKAYKDADGGVRLFRPMDNLARMNNSGDRMCIPPIDTDAVYGALVELIKLEAGWIPDEQGTSLYIRPSIIALDNTLGVHAAAKYLFFVILSPVAAYYAAGFNPIKLYVEQKYTRAAAGGTGSHKVIGNYAASIKAAALAAQKGYAQVMWLDAKERRYIEEIGSMNIFFVMNGALVTPALTGSILPGITRLSVMELARAKGMEVIERDITIDEVVAGIKSGACTEIFGTGTAVVISPVGALYYNEEEIAVGDGSTGRLSSEFFDELTGIQTGRVEDKFGWSKRII